ncbi:MAG TPA: AmmeMemoRadiSam system protein B [Anaerolineaceae bacterium]|nr:AmmeMemoRadiSam system protein B [Anaerolineaceae bacterium]
MKEVPDLRPSPIAGHWYEGDPDLLSAEVDQFLAEARLPDLTGEVMGVIAPHAGYRYSGAVAGYAFRAVAGCQYDLVAILSPMHQAYPFPLITSAHRAYSTPLGVVEIDQTALAALEKELGGRNLTALANDKEHSLEIELPFLQRALQPGFKLLPLMVREHSPRRVKEIGEALSRVLKDRRAMLVGSTDLSHFYPQKTAEELDAVTLGEIGAFSPEGLYREAENGRASACGLDAIAAVLWAAMSLGANRVQVLRHATSADVTGDRSSVVGYGAAVILRDA